MPVHAARCLWPDALETDEGRGAAGMRRQVSF